MLFTCTLQSDVLSRDTTCRGIGHLVCVCSRSSIPSVSPAAEPSENRTSNLTFAVMLFTCTLQSDVLSRDTTCRGIGHLVCVCSRSSISETNFATALATIGNSDRRPQSKRMHKRCPQRQTSNIYKHNPGHESQRMSTTRHRLQSQALLFSQFPPHPPCFTGCRDKVTSESFLFLALATKLQLRNPKVALWLSCSMRTLQSGVLNCNATCRGMRHTRCYPWRNLQRHTSPCLHPKRISQPHLQFYRKNLLNADTTVRHS